MYTGLRISYCSPGLDGSLESLLRESPMPSGQGRGQGTEARRLLVQQIRPGRGVLRTGYSLHFRKGVRRLHFLQPVPHPLALGHLPVCDSGSSQNAVWWQVLAGFFSVRWVAVFSARGSPGASTENVSAPHPSYDPSPKGPFIPSPRLWVTTPCIKDMAEEQTVKGFLHSPPHRSWDGQVSPSQPFS